MKKFWLMLMCLWMLCPCVHGEEEKMYEVKTRKEFYLLDAVQGQMVENILNGKKMYVLEYGEEWCKAAYGNQVGYCKTEYLYHFRSLNAMKYPLPGHQPMQGYISFEDEVFVCEGYFQGMTALPGQLACVRMDGENGSILPVWRSEMLITQEQASYHPFADWREAKPGEIIGGFTTFFGRQQGKGRIEERKFNIELGCERIHEAVVKSGEMFSFDALCAPYSQGNGYQYAPNISAKGYGYGGGVCQLTTTLYNAVLTLPLQVHEWEMHRYLGVDYVPQFYDAAVGVYDFTFENTLPYDIEILALPQEGMLTVLIQRK